MYTVYVYLSIIHANVVANYTVEWKPNRAYACIPRNADMVTAFMRRTTPSRWSAEDAHTVWRIWFNQYDDRWQLPCEAEPHIIGVVEFDAMQIHQITSSATIAIVAADPKSFVDIVDRDAFSVVTFPKPAKRTMFRLMPEKPRNKLARLALELIYVAAIELRYVHKWNVRHMDYGIAKLPAPKEARLVVAPRASGVAWENLDPEVQRKLGVKALKYLPHNIVQLMMETEVTLLVKLAREDRIFAELARNNHVWRALFKRDYGAVFDWCDGHIPLLLRGHEYLPKQLRDDDTDIEWRKPWYDIDGPLPWKRFYLHARRAAKLIRSNHDYRNEFALETAAQLRFMLAPSDPDGALPSPLRWRIVSFLYANVHEEKDTGHYYGYARGLQFTPDERAQLAMIVDSEVSTTSTQTAPAFIGTPFDDRSRVGAQIMAYYDGRSQVARAPVQLLQLYSRMWMYMRDTERMKRVMLSIRETHAALDRAEYASALVSTDRYDRDTCSDLMLCDSLIVDHMLRHNQEVRRNAAEMTQHMREHARFLVKTMLDYMIAPRKHIISSSSAPLLLCRICGPVTSLKWMHKPGDPDEGAAYCSDECAKKGLCPK